MKITTLAIFANITLLTISGSAMAAPPAGEGPKREMNQNHSMQYQHERRQQQRAQTGEQHSKGKTTRKQQRAQADEQHSEGKMVRKQYCTQADEQNKEGKVAHQQHKQSKKQKHAQQMAYQHQSAGNRPAR